MYKRILDLNVTLSRKSLFLLGPRQTGKSTFLRQNYPDALYVNLLKNSEFQVDFGDEALKVYEKFWEKLKAEK